MAARRIAFHRGGDRYQRRAENPRPLIVSLRASHCCAQRTRILDV